MEISEKTLAHIALDQMISANILLSEVDNVTPVLALEQLRNSIMQLMKQFDPTMADAVNEIENAPEKTFDNGE